MLRVIAVRLFSAVPSLLGAAVFTFVLFRALPGDPAAQFAGPVASAEAVAAIRHELGLDQPLLAQFGGYARALARGELGRSFTTGQPVGREMAVRLPASAELTVTALLLAVLAGVPLGVVAAMRPGSAVDALCRAVAAGGASVPVFVSGLVAVQVFYVWLGWAPPPLGRLDSFLPEPPFRTGFLLLDGALAGDWIAVRAAAGQLVLPAAVLAIFAMAPLARVVRASTLSALGAEFVRGARARGLPERRVVGYAVRNALLPVLATLGTVFSFLLGANVLVEKLFGWPGIGAYAADALIAADPAPVQGFVLVMAAVHIGLNLLIDLLYLWLDPRAAVG